MKTRIPPPILLLITGTVMWFVARSPYAFPVPVPYPLVLALIIGALGMLISVTALRQFKSTGTTVNPLKPEEASELVRTGIFGRSRNPMYVGLFLVLTAWSVWLSSLSNILVLILFWLAITELQIKPEEAALTKLFGQEYTDYCRQVRRWI